MVVHGEFLVKQRWESEKVHRSIVTGYNQVVFVTKEQHCIVIEHKLNSEIYMVAKLFHIFVIPINSPGTRSCIARYADLKPCVVLYISTSAV